ncbi:MAG TPA: universal stress protein [Gaiellales bacterium]|jgi:nucleotide-binding universal stress UspA family protein|nr:universal stress protein [Gaiellales bacterium]
MYDTVLIALDGSPSSTTAIPHAQLLAGEHGRIVAVYVHELVPGRSSQAVVPGPEAERSVREWVERVRHEGGQVDLRVETTAAGDAAEAIAAAAQDEHADVIVLGTRGHSQMTGLLLGSVAQRLPHVAPCPVLVVPPTEAQAG